MSNILNELLILRLFLIQMAEDVTNDAVDPQVTHIGYESADDSLDGTSTTPQWKENLL